MVSLGFGFTVKTQYETDRGSEVHFECEFTMNSRTEAKPFESGEPQMRIHCKNTMKTSREGTVGAPSGHSDGTRTAL